MRRMKDKIEGSITNADYANSAGSVAWDNISGKPSSYPPASHTHAYLPTGGGTMTGNITFSDIGNTNTSNKISWNGSTDGADIYYQTTAGDQGNLVLNLRDDSNCYLRIAQNGNFRSYFSPSDGNFHGNVNGNCYGYADYLYNEGIGNMRFHWSGQNGQPTWLWGSNDGSNAYVWNPSNFSVNYANSAGSATALNMNSAGNGNSIYGSGNDAVNGPGGGLNNVVISSWYGVSFTSPCGVGYGGKNQTAVGIDCREGIVKAARFDGSLNGTATNAEYLANDSAYMRMHWNGQSGQPSWLWGGNDASNMYVYNPSNFSVNYATTAGNGVYSSSIGVVSGYIRFNCGVQICWDISTSTSDRGSFTFPQNFVYDPCIVISGTGAYRYAFYITKTSSTSFSYYRDGTGSTVSPQYVAFGRWK